MSEFVSWDFLNFPTEWKVIKFHGSSHHQAIYIYMCVCVREWLKKILIYFNVVPDFLITAFGFVGFSCFSAIRENKDLLSCFSFSETPRSLICSNMFTCVQQIRASSSQ